MVRSPLVTGWLIPQGGGSLHQVESGDKERGFSLSLRGSVKYSLRAELLLLSEGQEDSRQLSPHALLASEAMLRVALVA